MTTWIWGGVTVDSALLAGYGYRDAITVGGTVYPRYLGYMAAGITEVGTRVASATALLAGSSGSSLTIASGAQTLVADAGKGWSAGMILTLAYDASRYMTGTVTSYDPPSGGLVLNVLDISGAGTYASWSVSLSGRSGPQGIQGIQGLTGLTGSGSTIAAAYNGSTVTAAPRTSLNTANSLVAADNVGAARIDLTLSGDTAAPGAAKVYGTDSGGSRGWQTVRHETQVAMAANNIDLNTGNYFTKTIAALTTFSVSNVPAAGIVPGFVLELTNGGAYTITWWSGIKWAYGLPPTLTAAGLDVLGFYSIDGGTTWRGLLLARAVA